MNQERQERLKACIQELATLLYEEADQSKLTDLEGIEKTVRSQILEHVSPEIAFFYQTNNWNPSAIADLVGWVERSETQQQPKNS
jgi:hypothetical protein